MPRCRPVLILLAFTGGMFQTVGPTRAQPVFFVDDDATGAGDGSSWCDSYTDLQVALGVATSGDEIRVAQGIYRPAGPGGDRNATFQLVNGVALLGGYAGCGAPDPDERDQELYETILSGDLNGDDGPGFTNRSDNSYHVLASIFGVDLSTVLDGLTISGSNAGLPAPQLHGGGLYNNGGSPTVLNCTFLQNWADNFGGAVYNIANSPLFINCTFIGNATANQGGAIWNSPNSMVTLSNCLFVANVAVAAAAIGNQQTTLALINCTLVSNAATVSGGGTSIGTDSSGTLVNCIFWGNTANGVSDEAAQIGGSPNVSYSLIQGWTGTIGGLGNIDSNPLFVRMPEPGADGEWDGVDDDYGDLRLLPGSPCIDAASNAAVPPDISDLDGDGDTGEPVPFDLDDSPRVVNGIVDMGAFEFQGVVPIHTASEWGMIVMTMLLLAAGTLVLRWRRLATE